MSVDLSQAKLMVVFATHNGADVLPAMLEGYAAVEQPDQPWAMVIVDNASTDATPQILKSFQDRLPLVVLHEPVPSKNRALNLALDHIGRDADLYIFTDDDAIPAPDFLRQWEKVVRDRPDHELFGAVVRPWFQQQPPSWLKRYAPYFDVLYAEIDREEGEMPALQIYGPNMAVRRSVLARGVRFNEEIGPNSSQPDYPMGSENEFCQRVAASSPTSPWFAAGPKVRHIVRPRQTTFDFVGRRAYRHGRGVAMRHALAEPDRPPRQVSPRGKVWHAVRTIGARLRIGTLWWHHNWHLGYFGWMDDYGRQRTARSA